MDFSPPKTHQFPCDLQAVKPGDGWFVMRLLCQRKNAGRKRPINDGYELHKFRHWLDQHKDLFMATLLPMCEDDARLGSPSRSENVNPSH
jgi:hypothetical protein